MQTYDSFEEIAGKGTFLPSSVTNFTKWMNGAKEKAPVEFCWNDVSESWDDKIDSIMQQPDFRTLVYYCMRPFNNNHNNPTDALAMRVTNRSGRPSIKLFYAYLFSKKSPWRSAFPALCFLGETKGVPDYIVWYDTSNTCSKVVANLFSAMRLHTCWGLDVIWMRLVDAGFTPEEAILLASNFSWAGQSLTVSNGPKEKFDEYPEKTLKLSKRGCSKTDMPFSTNYNPSGFKPLLVDKKPKSKGSSLKSGSSIQPNNYIWHEDGVEVNADTLKSSSKEHKSSRLKVNSSKTELYSMLVGKKALSKDYIEEVQEKLRNNEMLEI